MPQMEIQASYWSSYLQNDVLCYQGIILQTLNSSAIRSQGNTCTPAVAAAYVPYVVAKLLQMMLLNYASLKLCFA